MTEHLGHRLEVCAAGQREGSCAVPQVVQSDGGQAGVPLGVAMERAQSSLSVGAVTPLTWRGQDGKVHRRVTFELRGVMVLPRDAAGSFETDLREAIRDAESA